MIRIEQYSDVVVPHFTFFFTFSSEQNVKEKGDNKTAATEEKVFEWFLKNVKMTISELKCFEILQGPTSLLILLTFASWVSE